MLRRPIYARPDDAVKAEEEPQKFIEVEVTDIDIQYPDGVFIGLTINTEKGDSIEYRPNGKDTTLVVTKGKSEAHYNLHNAFYHAFRERTMKVPEPHYVPPSAMPASGQAQDIPIKEDTDAEYRPEDDSQ